MEKKQWGGGALHTCRKKLEAHINGFGRIWKGLQQTEGRGCWLKKYAPIGVEKKKTEEIRSTMYLIGLKDNIERNKHKILLHGSTQ